MTTKRRIFLAGHRGLVGSALRRRLEASPDVELILRTRQQLDLLDQSQVFEFFAKEKPTHVILAAAKVGGIAANSASPASFLYENLVIETNVIEGARRTGCERFVFLGSSCIYPKLADQPLKEEYLLSGPLEPTNEWYAVAKIAGIKLCQAYRRQHGMRAISLMPTNLYGPDDNFDLETSHVLPALIRKFHEAKEGNVPSVGIWGTGKPRREFLHVDDLADATVFLMEHYDEEQLINVGVGEDLTIRELANLIQEVVGYQGDIHYDSSRPDGTPRKLLDVSKIRALGWQPQVPLRKGIEDTYSAYRSSLGSSS